MSTLSECGLSSIQDHNWHARQGSKLVVEDVAPAGLSSKADGPMCRIANRGWLAERARHQHMEREAGTLHITVGSSKI
jgi:hypothetical protein